MNFGHDRKPQSIQPPTMPLKARQNIRDSAKRESRILLAVSAIQEDEIHLVRQAAHTFNIPETTVSRRLRGTTSRLEARAKSHKITRNEVESLI